MKYISWAVFFSLSHFTIDSCPGYFISLCFHVLPFPLMCVSSHVRYVRFNHVLGVFFLFFFGFTCVVAGILASVVGTFVDIIIRFQCIKVFLLCIGYTEKPTYIEHTRTIWSVEGKIRNQKLTNILLMKALRSKWPVLRTQKDMELWKKRVVHLRKFNKSGVLIRYPHSDSIEQDTLSSSFDSFEEKKLF